MNRFEGSRKQQVMLVCAILLVIASSFPFAMSGKTLGMLIWIGASTTSLLMGITRLRILGKATVVLASLFAASFFAPIEVVFAQEQSPGINWMRCEVIGTRDRLKSSSHTTFVICRGCTELLGIEPSHVVKISVPQ